MQPLPDGAALMFYEDLRALKIALDAIMVNKAVLKPVMGEKTLALAEIEHMKLQQFFGGSPVTCGQQESWLQSYKERSKYAGEQIATSAPAFQLRDMRPPFEQEAIHKYPESSLFNCPNCGHDNERRDIECSNCGVLY